MDDIVDRVMGFPQTVRLINGIYYQPGFGPRPKLRRTCRPRDSQRAKVYEWEKDLVKRFNKSDEKFDSLDDVRFFYGQLAYAYNIDCPGVEFRRSKSGGAKANRTRVKFHGELSSRLVIHEFAHVLTNARFGFTVQGHGPEYVSVYIHLLERYMGIPANVARIAAEEAGINHGKVFR